MKFNTLFWRLVSYFRLGYSYYISFIVAVGNFMMISYYIMLERIPLVKSVFSHFINFIISFFFILIPLGVAIGYFHARRTEAMATDGYVSTRANPLNIVPSYIFYKEFLRIEEKLGVKPSEEMQKLFKFYEREMKHQKWRP